MKGESQLRLLLSSHNLSEAGACHVGRVGLSSASLASILILTQRERDNFLLKAFLSIHLHLFALWRLI